MTTPCRAVRVLCAAGSPHRLAELKRAAVGVEWELVGGATSVQELESQVAEFLPDVIVIDESLGSESAAAARLAAPRARIIGVGTLAGVDSTASAEQDVRAAILGVPPGL
jgi:chemotaxis response regulator CheB